MKTENTNKEPNAVSRYPLLGDVLSLIDNNQDIFINAIDQWGEPSQIIMVIEELAELQKELCKAFRKDDYNYNLIMKEMADVIIMLGQLFIIMNKRNKYHDRQLRDEITVKINRLKSKLNMSPNVDSKRSAAGI